MTSPSTIPPPHTTPARRAATAPGILIAFQSLLYIVVVASFIITFTIQPFRIPSESMEPTLLVGDFLLVNKLSLGFDNAAFPLAPAAIHRGEIIVFHFPSDPSIHLIKRVIGLPGDHLRLRNNRVYIDGQPLDEPYAVYRPGAPDPYRDNFPRLQNADPAINSHWWIAMHHLIENDQLIVPAGSYFVLGDNRNDSEDSRYWGFVPRAAIVGKPLLIYFSLNQPSPGDDPPQLTASHPPPPRLSILNSLFSIARWDRTFRLVH